MKERMALIEEVTKLKEENDALDMNISALADRKAELLRISEEMSLAISDRAVRELECLKTERAFITQKSIEKEESLKAAYETKLSVVMKQKEDIERRIESESEYIARNLRERLITLHSKTHKLREELYARTMQVSKDYSKLASNEALQLAIKANQDHCRDVAAKIAESHREVEGLIMTNNRLQSILSRLSPPETRELPAVAITDRPRRSSAAGSL